MVSVAQQIPPHFPDGKNTYPPSARQLWVFGRRRPWCIKGRTGADANDRKTGEEYDNGQNDLEMSEGFTDLRPSKFPRASISPSKGSELPKAVTVFTL